MSQVQEIFLIGEDFEPGIVGNSEIDILLGHDTAICGEFAIRKEDGYTHCPDYCEDKNITFRELYKLNLHPLILPASHESSKRRSKSFRESRTASRQVCCSLYSWLWILRNQTIWKWKYSTSLRALVCACLLLLNKIINKRLLFTFVLFCLS